MRAHPYEMGVGDFSSPSPVPFRNSRTDTADALHYKNDVGVGNKHTYHTTTYDERTSSKELTPSSASVARPESDKHLLLTNTHYPLRNGNGNSAAAATTKDWQHHPLHVDRNENNSVQRDQQRGDNMRRYGHEDELRRPPPTVLLKDLVELDTVPVRQAEDRQIVEEHYLAEMKRAVGQADKAESDCDDARRRIKQLKHLLDASAHKRNSTAAIVDGYRSRLEAMNADVEANRLIIVELTDRKNKAVERAKAAERERHLKIRDTLAKNTAAAVASGDRVVRGVVEGGNADPDPFSVADPLSIEASLDRLRYEVECEERRVASLRTRHADAHKLAKDVRNDVELLQSRLQQTEKRRAELETTRLQLAAMEANMAYQDASATFAEYKTLLEKSRQQQREISSTRVEGQSMVLHLIEGTKARAEAINKERRRLMQEYKNKYGVATEGGAIGTGGGGGGGALSLAAEATLNDLIALNMSRRSELVELIVSSAAEKEALEQYIGVLSERCNGLIQQIRDKEEESRRKRLTLPA